MTAEAVSYTRQRDWFDPADHPDAHVTIVGVGGIGSPTALALAKLGIPRLTLIDPDTVEAHNLPNQMFIANEQEYGTDVGRAKVVAMADGISEYTGHEFGRSGVEVDAIQESLNHESLRYCGLVISGLDSMSARQELWDRLKGNIGVELYLDARLGGESVVIYAVRPHHPNDIAWYESEALFPDEEMEAAPCTRQSIIDVGFVVASLLTRQVRRHYADEEVEPLIFWDQANLIIAKGGPSDDSRTD